MHNTMQTCSILDSHMLSDSFIAPLSLPFFSFLIIIIIIIITIIIGYKLLFFYLKSSTSS